MAKTVIFANGISGHPEKNQQYISDDDKIICADGGTLYALQMGLVPDILVGDFDSLPVHVLQGMKNKNIVIEQFPEKKDKTDLELALQISERFDTDEVLILTALGGRMDQYLSNILLLTRTDWKQKRIRIADGNQQGWILKGPDELILTGQKGDILSVIPISTQIDGLYLSGLEWSLTNEKIERGSTLTLSNNFKGNKATIKIKSGICLVVKIEKRGK
ncbi:thiamine diphosphokinase [candidate division KSB1 bacterium]|nr:thiamine diphosphokinase [candidate division KSB1 bacterium]